jgi:signal transduction histidine kinase
MTLRTRLLITFIALGAVPLMVVGWVTSQRNLRAVEDLVARETRLVAERVSEEIGSRYDARLGEVLFLAGNEETYRLFAESSLPSFGLEPEGPRAFLKKTWEDLEGRYRRIQFRDSSGRVVLDLPANDEAEDLPPTPRQVVISEDILAADGERILGRASAFMDQSALLPSNLPERGFGEGGFVALIDTESERVLYHPEQTFLSQSRSELLPISTREMEPALEGDGTLEYSHEGQTWVGSLAPVRNTSWAVLSSSPLQGFARPFRSAARANLLLIFTITALAALAFLVSTLRTTRSLIHLTGAARKVAEGDLDPDLPPPGKDEIGVLSGTFKTMLARIRSMIMQVEENRQMAAVGEFSAQIAHELRNPLTAVRMSLQGLLRKLGETEHARPLEIALQETARLDRVASGVLSLGRRVEGVVTDVSAVALVQSAIRAVESELQDRGVEIEVKQEAPDLRVPVDEESLRGALINLLRNSVEAMPGGGAIQIVLRATDDGTMEIHIKDSGPGVPEDIADKIFDPFVTTKERGNGFGLPLALRAAEATGGRLRLLDSGPSKGAHFVLEIPTELDQVTGGSGGGR